jgi:phosphoserine phosphatase
MASTKVAVFRVEGTLVSRGSLACSAYFAANGQGFRERALRLGQVALASPLLGLLRQADGTTTQRAAFAACRGMSEDRLVVLAEEFRADHLEKSVMESGLDLLARARREGYLVWLISELPAEVIEPLARSWRHVDRLVTNRLELVSGKTTGRLLEPVLGGHETARWLQDEAREAGVDLAASRAYAASGADLLLLAAVGEPCAVNADYNLRRAATESRWALLDYVA